ncbi:uncharacterized protein LOC144126343 [Amblyomma americanum]
MLFVLLQMCGALPKLVEKGKFQVCEGEYSVITAGKAAKCGSRILQQCMAYTVMRYGLSTSVCQRGFKTICVYIRLCFHKRLPTQLSPPSVDLRTPPTSTLQKRHPAPVMSTARRATLRKVFTHYKSRQQGTDIKSGTLRAFSRYKSDGCATGHQRHVFGYETKDLQDATGFLIDGRKCLLENNLIPESIDVALQCVRWRRTSVF